MAKAGKRKAPIAAGDTDAASAAKKAKAAIRSARPELYAARQFLDRDTQAKILDLRISFDVYFQDPFVTGSDAAYDFDEAFVVPWEPGLATARPARALRSLTMTAPPRS